MNFIENIIGAVSPKAALQRARYRAAKLAIDEQVRRYEAAAKGRRTSGWVLGGGSANTETATALITLRNVSRDLTRNDTYAKKAVQVITSNTVGTGIQPTPVGTAGKVKRIKRLWKDWAETTACDWDGQHTIYGLQRLAMRTIVESGEVIILKRRVNDSNAVLPLQIQVVEPDYIDSARDVKQKSDGGWITQGIEYNKEGKKTHYWLYKQHPGEGMVATSERVPASDVMHVYLVERPGQARGVPFGVSAFLKQNDFKDYESAELVRQKIAACFAAFVEDANPDAVATSGTDTDMLERIEPGIIEQLPAGKRMSFASPPTTDNYDSYSRRTLQGIAAGYGTTYEAISGDLSKVNFSSGRMGWLEFQRQVTEWQELMLVPMLCSRLWSWFMDAATMAKGITPDGIDVSWTPPRREMIDPWKETKALELQVQAGFISWQEAVGLQGYDPEMILEELKMDADRFKKGELVLSVDLRNKVRDAGTTSTGQPSENS